MKRYALYSAVLLFVVMVAMQIIAIQFVPVTRTNRLGAGDPPAPRDVQWALRRACYDCHSTETRWPIWAYVAPMSWQVVGDVNRARLHLNFSDWQKYTPLMQQGLLMNINRVLVTHRMPLWYYVSLHPDAKLTPQEMRAVRAWTLTEETRAR
jgi:heme-binding protein